MRVKTFYGLGEKHILWFIDSGNCFSDFQVSGEKIGFIGLGNMGGYMAMNLAKKGHPLVIHDMKAESIAKVKNEGKLYFDN